MLLIQTLVCVMTLIRFIRVQIGKDLDGKNHGSCMLEHNYNLGARAEIVKFFRWYFGRNDDTKRTF